MALGLIVPVRAVAQASIPQASMGPESMRWILGLLLVVALWLLALIVLYVRWARPLHDMIRMVEQLAQGQTHMRLSTDYRGVMGRLAAALNRMAAQTEERANDLTNQRNEAEAVLLSMMEGVLAVNAQEELMLINQAACDLLGVESPDALGKPILEVVRNAQLQRFIQQALAQVAPSEGVLTLRDEGGERILQVRGTLLRNNEQETIGVLVVLDDITRVRRLEDMRRDFVANVSHELKTPITSIKGFVETLMDGALEEPEEARRFLTIIARQAERLSAIIRDLLSLSHLEQDMERGRLERDHVQLAAVVAGAIQSCQPRAQAKNVELTTLCEDGLSGYLNASLLEQALINLIDNAVKFSESGGRVSIGARSADDHIILYVQDWGCGIARENLPRLFERFYRVDSGRSRAMGGTGLGLAIVKHIARAHGGRVHVKSEFGKGSIFSLEVPKEVLKEPDGHT